MRHPLLEHLLALLRVPRTVNFDPVHIREVDDELYVLGHEP